MSSFFFITGCAGREISDTTARIYPFNRNPPSSILFCQSYLSSPPYGRRQSQFPQAAYLLMRCGLIFFIPAPIPKRLLVRVKKLVPSQGARIRDTVSIHLSAVSCFIFRVDSGIGTWCKLQPHKIGTYYLCYAELVADTTAPEK